MTVLTLQPAGAAGLDTYIDQLNPTSNFATSDLRVGEQSGNTNLYRTLIKFDLSSIPSDATINSAVLTLNITTDNSVNDRTMRAYRLKKAWVEAQATWNIYSTGNNWTTAGGFDSADCEQTDIGSVLIDDATATSTTIDITLTASAVQEWVSGAFANNGILLKMDTELNDAWRFSSSDAGTASLRPQLVVIYNDAPPNAITISTPLQYQTYQRSGSTGSIPITGTYTGSPTAIEASFNGGAYSTIVASPAGGTFSGTLSSQTQGQGTLTVRFTNDTAANDTKTFVGIGDVFLVAGQSNAAGRFTNLQTYSHATLKATMFRTDDNWLELADPTEFGSEGPKGSVWPKLATLLMADQSVPVAFITTALTGTGLCAPNANWAQGGSQYNVALDQIQDSVVNGIKAALWYQGEKDMDNAVSQSDYQTALSLMLDNMQTDFAIGTFSLVSALPAYQGTATDAQENAIRSAIINRWDNDSDILAGPTSHDQSFADGVHWTTDAEATRLAGRWFRALKYHFYSGSEPARGPQATTATYSGNVITVTFSGGQGSLANASDATGWEVSDGAGRTISSAAANGTNKVDLTLSGAPTAPVTVSFCSGDNGAGATLQDSGTYPLPPEPIVAMAVTASNTGVPTQSMYYTRARQMA